MIKNTFLFLDGIGKETERRLWQNGIREWDDFVQCGSIAGISNFRKKYYERKIEEAKKHFYNFNTSYFASVLPLSEQWRLYDYLKDEAVFLDIETSGLSVYDSITVIGLFDGIETKTMINGINFNPSAIQKELQKFKLLITFNGASFDLPFIKRRFPNLLPTIPHIDLRHVCSRVGLTGGLKTIERVLGIQRSTLVERMHGGDAAVLWRMYKATGDDHYLKLLIEYNEEDIINLKKVADVSIGRLKEQTFIK